MLNRIQRQRLEWTCTICPFKPLFYLIKIIPEYETAEHLPEFIIPFYMHSAGIAIKMLTWYLNVIGFYIFYYIIPEDDVF